MLDSETKAKIDSARDILVGKVPDPKSQVEQITIALIYKFMDDMDRQSEELGGKATFFTGEFKKYRWGHLLDKRMGGHERLLLYAEGIEKMNENAAIPQLFRDIFKGVFLPYRDPETLNWFLKEINGFTYDHSERLGDAFEYLLSVLGTQGNAGQFRTPRHIIDFIVAIVAPKKNETVLDPACGTAGFLISAYKHIVAADKDLSPDERERLMTNFAGYDIAPDMCRLSRVNMYLHGFPNPTIHEYDALTSEERWDERYDIVMANPPFMSPKGGIRPHNRFAIKAKRSEVLFVDYIAEHLNPGGRAGVIVPEGIIFQAQNAYKNLRRMLVENHLWAVVSLPAGVFNPYSGVKTSILFLDRNLAKRTEDILFVKVTNDGFGLGAQRRAVGGSELPEALRILDSHKEAQKTQEGKMALTVSRKRILESADCGLSGERYRTVAVRGNGRWPMVRLGDDRYFRVESGGTPSSKIPEYWNGSIRWATLVDLPAEGVFTELWDTQRKITDLGLAKSSAILLPPDTVLVSSRATIGRIAVTRVSTATNQGFKNIVITDRSAANPRYLAYAITRLVPRMEVMASGGTFKEISKTNFSNLEISLPPLDEQARIVAELDGYRKVIEGARQVVENYKSTIQVDPAWPIQKMGDLCDLVRGSSPRPKSDLRYYGGTVPRLMVADLTRDGMYVTPKIDFLTEEGSQFSRPMKKNDVVMAVSGNPGLTAILEVDAFIHDGFVGFRELAKDICPEFLFYVLSHMKEHSGSQSIGAVFKNLTTTQIKEFDIPVPSMKVQRQVVDEIESERQIIESNRRLIGMFEGKIQQKLAEVWGKRLPREGVA